MGASLLSCRAYSHNIGELSAIAMPSRSGHQSRGPNRQRQLHRRAESLGPIVSPSRARGGSRSTRWRCKTWKAGRGWGTVAEFWNYVRPDKGLAGRDWAAGGALGGEDVVGDVSIAFRGTGIGPMRLSHCTNEAAAATLAIERQVGPIASAGRSGCAARNGPPWLPRWDPVGPEGLCRDLVGTLQWRENVWKWCLWEMTWTLGPLLFLFAAAPSTRFFPSCIRLPPPPSVPDSPDALPAMSEKSPRLGDAI